MHNATVTPPLCQRVYKSVGQTTVPSGPTTGLSRPGKYKLWSTERMDKALNAVLYGHTSIRRAALDYDIPKSTLGD